MFGFAITERPHVYCKLQGQSDVSSLVSQLNDFQKMNLELEEENRRLASQVR